MRGIYYLHIYINGIKYYYNTSRKLSVRGNEKAFKHIYYPIHKASVLDRKYDYADIINGEGKLMMRIDRRRDKEEVLRFF